MSDVKRHWSKKEFKTYLLYYCANADFIEKDEEKAFILSKMNGVDINMIHEEFVKDNDYGRINRIREGIDYLQFSHNETESLIEEVMQLFMSDGRYDQLEKNIYLGLKRILNKK